MGKKKKRYSRHNLLSKKMLELHPMYPEFVSGSECGLATYFFCRVCHRDVSMASHGAGEFERHFGSDGHWKADVAYRVHMGLPVFNKLMEPMKLTAKQVSEFGAMPFVDKAEGYPFPEDLLPKHAKPESKVPFMTLISCLSELLRGGGDFTTLRRLWGHFRVTLPEAVPEYTINWSRSETLVSCHYLFCFFFSLLMFVFFFFLFLFFTCVRNSSCLLQSLLCQGLALRVLYVAIANASRFGYYSLDFCEREDGRYCHLVCWEEGQLRKICVGVEPVDIPLLDSELIPLSRVVCAFDAPKLPVSLHGASVTLTRVIEDNRTDGGHFVVFQLFGDDEFLQLFRQAYNDIFGMVEVVTIVEHVVHRLKSCLRDEWLLEHPVLVRCVRQGYVNLCDMRALVDVLVDLWPQIRSVIRYTGHPDAKEKSDRVGYSISLMFCCRVLLFIFCTL